MAEILAEHLELLVEGLLGLQNGVLPAFSHLQSFCSWALEKLDSNLILSGFSGVLSETIRRSFHYLNSRFTSCLLSYAHQILAEPLFGLLDTWPWACSRSLLDSVPCP